MKNRGSSITDTVNKTAGETLYEIWRDRLVQHSGLAFPEWRLVSGDLKVVWETAAARFLKEAQVSTEF